MKICPLCIKSDTFNEVKGPDNRTFTLCGNCQLIFTETRFQLSKSEEEVRYKKHNNSITNKGYVQFLNQAINPTLPFLNREMKGLDFGCGPQPVLAELLKMQGFDCDNYDPIFFPELEIENKYDFIFATECFEHFFFPAKEIQKIKNLLKVDGYLIVMTDRWTKTELFKSWTYARDKTHVSFYHGRTMEFIAKKYSLSKIWMDQYRVTLYKKTELDQQMIS